MLNLQILDKVVKGKSFTPSNLESIYYLFLEKGVAFNEFNRLPIPYIFSIINTHSYVKKEEERAYKKSNKK